MVSKTVPLLGSKALGQLISLDPMVILLINLVEGKSMARPGCRAWLGVEMLLQVEAFDYVSFLSVFHLYGSVTMIIFNSLLL
jgi:hypothetical protein